MFIPGKSVQELVQEAGWDRVQYAGFTQRKINQAYQDRLREAYNFDIGRFFMMVTKNSGALQQEVNDDLLINTPFVQMISIKDLLRLVKSAG